MQNRLYREDASRHTNRGLAVLFHVTFDTKRPRQDKFHPRTRTVDAKDEAEATELARQQLVSEGFEVQFVLSIKPGADSLRRTLVD